MFVRLWEAAKTLITDWECPVFPDMGVSLSDAADPKVTQIIIWAGLKVMDQINVLDSVAENPVADVVVSNV